MADNAGYTEGSGVIIAADEVGGVLHQRVKLSLGADGSATDVPIGQQVSGLSIPVVLPAAQITTLTPPAAITGFSTEATLSSLNAKVTAVNTGAVVVSSSALPSGASTSANQTTIIGHVDGIETALTTLNAKDFATQTTLAALNTKVTAVNTGAVVVSSSALPTGAATEATLSTLNGKVTACNTGAVVVSSSAIPTGAATAANQTTEITHLSAINSATTDIVTNTSDSSIYLSTIADAISAEDNASLNAHSGIKALAVRQDTPANTSGTDGDYEFLKMSGGRLWTSSTVTSSALPSGAATESTLGNVAISAADILVSMADLPSTFAAFDSTGIGTYGISIAGIRRDAETSPVSADGDAHPFVFNDFGRLKVSTLPAPVSATVDTITSNGDTVSLDTTQCSNISFHCTGTFSTINCTFEGSVNGGTNWFAVQAVRTNANTVELTTGNLSAAPAYGWEASVNGLTNFRLRATAFTSGTQTWTILPGVYATEPIPAIQTHAVTMTSTTITSLVPGTAATSLGKAEDAVHASGDTGVPFWGVRRDTPVTSVSAAGDYCEHGISGQGALWTSLTPSVGGGWTPYKLLSAASTNATSLKASAGTLGSFYLFNTTASIKYFKLYNKASSPTVGTDTPVLVIPIPASSGATEEWSNGMKFSTGIAFAITGAVADSDTTAIGANEVIVNLGWL